MCISALLCALSLYDAAVKNETSSIVFSVFSVGRDEIAGCIDKAYTKIALSEAARMLFFDSQKPMQDYAQQVKLYLEFQIMMC